MIFSNAEIWTFGKHLVDYYITIYTDFSIGTISRQNLAQVNGI